jgi:hypothetical protein
MGLHRLTGFVVDGTRSGLDEPELSELLENSSDIGFILKISRIDADETVSPGVLVRRFGSNLGRYAELVRGCGVRDGFPHVIDVSGRAEEHPLARKSQQGRAHDLHVWEIQAWLTFPARTLAA